MLRVDSLYGRYGRIEVLKDLSLTIQKGEIVALIGANGAGKTTLLRLLSGIHPAAGGSVFFNDTEITNVPANQRVRMGIAHVPEGRQVFGPLSVLDNLSLGAFVHGNADQRADLDRILALFPILKEKLHLAAGTLSGGQQQMLALGRALMARPKLLFLDEPSMGLAPLIVEEVFRIIQSLRRSGTTIFLVEQNAHLALKISDRAYVMESGKIVMDGSSASIRDDSAVQKAYLGL
jgi:branched-chain amino acid transport system ATP-binding protein